MFGLVVIVFFSIGLALLLQTCVVCQKSKCLYIINKFYSKGVQYNVCDECCDKLILEYINKETSK